MSTTRATIAAALSTVPGLKGHETKPTTIRVGDCWPLINGFIRGRGRTVAAQWRIVMFLGQDELKAEEMFGSMFWPVADALRSLAVVDDAEAFMFPTEAGQAFAAAFIARSEYQ